MFMFPDGRAYVLTFNQVEQRYYAAFVDEFPEADVSISQWRGGYEYQTLYPAIQMMVENGMMTLDALNEILGVIAAGNQSIYRPAVLQSRVAERFKQAGYEATARVADINTRGIVAICVDQERSAPPVRTMTIGVSSTNPENAGFSPAFGSIDSATLANNCIITTLASEGVAGSQNSYMYTSPSFGVAGDSMTGTFNGAAVTWVNSTSVPGQWDCNGQGVAEYLRANVGESATFTFDVDAVAVNDDDELIGNLIRDEMLPAGQHMEGDIEHQTALSNGQPLTIRWRTPTKTPHEFRTTIQRARGSQHPMDSVDEIIIKFNLSYNARMGIGIDITPATYLTTANLPWAASVLTEWSDDGGATWSPNVKQAQFFDQFLAELDPANVVIV